MLLDEGSDPGGDRRGEAAGRATEATTPRRFLLDGEKFHHLRRVLRLSAGDRLEVVADGRVWPCVVADIGEERLEARVAGTPVTPPARPVQLTLIQALPKGRKLELVVKKATELGVHAVVPVVTDHTVVKLSEDKAETRRSRWQRLARAAARQSRRVRVPRVEPVQPWTAALDAWSQSDSTGLSPVVCWTGETATSVRQGLSAHRRAVAQAEQPVPVAVAVGPEGGWSEREIAAARRRDLTTVSLGPSILRTETAGIVAVALLLYELAGTAAGD